MKSLLNPASELPPAAFANALLPVKSWVLQRLKPEGSDVETLGFELDQDRISQEQWDAITAMMAERTGEAVEAVRADIRAGNYLLGVRKSNFITTCH